jgi:hypothetical protein
MSDRARSGDPERRGGKKTDGLIEKIVDTLEDPYHNVWQSSGIVLCGGTGEKAGVDSPANGLCLPRAVSRR